MMRTIENLVDGVLASSAGIHDYRTVLDPRTESPTTQFRPARDQDIQDAVAAASTAQAVWATHTPGRRAELLLEACDRLESLAPRLAELEAEEMGKTHGFALAGIQGAIQDLREACALVADFPFATVIEHEDGGSTEIRRAPLGVAAVITPWNYPVGTVLFGIGHLLLTGNTVVVKPSEKSPSAPLLAVEAMGLPAGVANVLVGDGETGAGLVASDEVQFVHFTGSVATGRAIAATCATKLVRCVLELGGKDPVFVDRAIDVPRVAAAVAEGSYLNSGQICTSMERIFVHAEVADEFLDELVRATCDSWSNSEDEERVGPLVDAAQLEIVEEHVNDAVRKGARVLTGGVRQPGPGYYFPPTVLAGITADMVIAERETFGPIAPVQVVADIDEALSRARESSFGLGLTVYSRDPAVQRAASEIPAALVWVNQWQGSWTHREYEPWGESGMGPTGGMAAFHASTRPVSVYRAAGNGAL